MTERFFLVLCAACVLLAGCQRPTGDDEERRSDAPRGIIFPPELPINPGPQPAQRFVGTENPFREDRIALRDGERYYMWYNCAGCHGALGGGGIGPPLRDDDWIYGGDAASIYQSIAQGRPQGMPAYGGIASDDMIWKMAGYIQALAAGEDVGPQPPVPAGTDASMEEAQAEGAPARGATPPGQRLWERGGS
jgi:cytochrome c oxidase cbb3-type subunit III